MKPLTLLLILISHILLADQIENRGIQENSSQNSEQKDILKFSREFYRCLNSDIKETIIISTRIYDELKVNSEEIRSSTSKSIKDWISKNIDCFKESAGDYYLFFVYITKTNTSIYKIVPLFNSGDSICGYYYSYGVTSFIGKKDNTEKDAFHLKFQLTENNSKYEKFSCNLYTYVDSDIACIISTLKNLSSKDIVKQIYLVRLRN